uniref:Peptidase S1 domain-containing protein n=1 Tax=Rhodosorus marinus TaxID=101924 RepID=A0A7S3ECQ8_9RHOD|mmetsp:Transcript_26273/g.102709  ORF Transcript_26273/g.102709 Transcript_26273/m.102709 type:complete len:280 (+) Transcript_26273:391-1230(+)
MERGRGVCLVALLLAGLVAGEVTFTSRYPYIGAMIGGEGEDAEVFCSAALLAKDTAITAARCIKGHKYERSRIKVCFGMHDPAREPSICSYVQRAVVHPDFRLNRPENDIAVFSMESAVGWRDVDGFRSRLRSVNVSFGDLPADLSLQHIGYRSKSAYIVESRQMLYTSSFKQLAPACDKGRLYRPDSPDESDIGEFACTTEQMGVEGRTSLAGVNRGAFLLHTGPSYTKDFIVGLYSASHDDYLDGSKGFFVRFSKHKRFILFGLGQFHHRVPFAKHY